MRMVEENLNSELTNGRDYDYANSIASIPSLSVKALQSRNQESKRLARAGLGTAENIASSDEMKGLNLPKK